MGCWTAYLVRDLDGQWRSHGVKYGAWLPLTADERDRILERVRSEGRPLVPCARPWLDGCWCRGVLLDRVDRRLRVYACSGQILRPAVGWIESRQRSLARAPIWAGWDVGYAWSRRDELRRLAPAAASAIVPEASYLPELGDLERARIEIAAPLAWDRERMHLRCAYDAPDYGALVSVIDENLDVLDYGFAPDLAHAGPAALPWLGCGAPWLDQLLATPPHPLPYEHEVDEGVIVDRPAREIRYWGPLAPVSSLDAARAAWPGWRIERLAYGFAGHLAATGRTEPEALMFTTDTDRDQRRDQSRDQFNPDWLAQRLVLPRDPRPLRHVELSWGPEA